MFKLKLFKLILPLLTLIPLSSMANIPVDIRINWTLPKKEISLFIKEIRIDTGKVYIDRAIVDIEKDDVVSHFYYGDLYYTEVYSVKFKNGRVYTIPVSDCNNKDLINLGYSKAYFDIEVVDEKNAYCSVRGE